MAKLRTLLTKPFGREARKAGLGEDALVAAAGEIEEGKVEARLGGYLVKKRVARPGGGKSGGFRAIVAHRQGDRLVFLHLFAKSAKGNIEEGEKQALHEFGDILMGFDDAKLAEMIGKGAILEIGKDDEEEQRPGVGA